MGDVQGVFVADSTEVNKAIGDYLVFGEILGKHSDIMGTLEEKDLTILTEDQDFISKFEQFLPRGSGYNPLNYLAGER
jgi:hypothetical protein